MADAPAPDPTKGPVGGPGSDITQQPAKFEFKFGDKTFSSQDELTTHLTNLSRETEDLRRRVTAPAPPPAATVAPAPASNSSEDAELIAKFFASPKKFLDDYGAQVETKIRQEIITQQAAREGMEQFWGAAWADLEKVGLTKAKHQGFVNGVFSSAQKDIGSLSLVNAKDELVKRVKDAVTSISPKEQRRERDPNDRTTVEGGASSGRKQATEGDTQKPVIKSLSDAIRARRASRLASSGVKQQAN